MPDGEAPQVPASRRLAELVEHIRAAQKKALNQEPPITDRAEQVVFIRNSTSFLALTLGDALLDSFIERNLASKAADKRHGIDSAPKFWDLDETLILNHRQGTVVKSLGKFTIEDGDRLTHQKSQNIVTAIRARTIWEWKWGLVKPHLEANPKWLFEDAFAHIRSQGLPEPPDFGDDEDEGEAL